MGLETFNFLDSLNVSNPDGAVDGKNEGDNHIRGIKTTLKNSFPNVNAAVNPTPTEFNRLVGITSALIESAGAQSLAGDKTFNGAVVLNGALSGTSVDTDGGLAANSDTRVASQKAVKTYVDGAVAPVMLSTPITLVSTNSPATVATAVGDALLDAANASIAIIQIQATCSKISGSGAAGLRVAVGDSASVTDSSDAWRVAYARAYTLNESGADFNMILTPLDVNNDFWYDTTTIGSGVSVNLQIKLWGYYTG